MGKLGPRFKSESSSPGGGAKVWIPIAQWTFGQLPPIDRRCLSPGRRKGRIWTLAKGPRAKWSSGASVTPRLIIALQPSLGGDFPQAEAGQSAGKPPTFPAVPEFLFSEFGGKGRRSALRAKWKPSAPSDSLVEWEQIPRATVAEFIRKSALRRLRVTIFRRTPARKVPPPRRARDLLVGT